MKKLHGLLSVLLLAGSMATHAGVITTNGSLASSPASDFDTFSFQVDALSTVSLSLDGNTDAFLILFSGIDTFNSSTFIDQDDDGGFGLDSLLSLSLAASNYTAFITTHGNFWDGSAIVNDHDHAPMDYTLTITGLVSSVSVPEPSGIALLGLGLAGIGCSRKKKTS